MVRDTVIVQSVADSFLITALTSDSQNSKLEGQTMDSFLHINSLESVGSVESMKTLEPKSLRSN